jgi:hypothetical protein
MNKVCPPSLQRGAGYPPRLSHYQIGYIRVSKQEQNEALQVNALKDAGCEKVFTDKITGSKLERDGLDEALAYIRRGVSDRHTRYEIDDTPYRVLHCSSAVFRLGN